MQARASIAPRSTPRKGRLVGAALAIRLVAALTAGCPPRRRCLAAAFRQPPATPHDHDQPSELQAMAPAIVPACSEWAPVWHGSCLAGERRSSATFVPEPAQKIPPGISTFG